MFNENLQKIIGFFLIILAAFIVIKGYGSLQERSDLPPTNVISISATGEVFVKPDVAQLSASVVREALTVADAQKQHTEAINRVTEILRQSGIEDKDIKTSAYNIFPLYDYIETKGRVFKGYEVSQTLDVKIRNLDNVGKVLAGATEAGANQIGGISFVIDDQDAVKREARKQAIDKAKEKASQIESDLGIKLGKLINFSESGGDFPIYKFAEGLGMGGDIGAVPAPDLPAGENQVLVTVNLTYEIK